ncbi:DUF4142 domain-containing protein [Sphingomonas lutea]|uniref:DUF4142 domain-containing protein n=1 Tax=Sphingomonas lutea TaxID=1045317 RepID=A0A7G9SI22_9SPHN|nr:DUF4142 domain-containing protein [Sphingomonas lutea]QNN67497.1 DUF4142 domain-containing protein [Sphingomonas lutea]
MRKTLIHLAVLGLPLLAAGCGGSDRPPPLAASTAARPLAATAAPAGPAISAAAYISNAASIDLFAVRSANVALQRSTNLRTREFASMMVAAHRGTAAQLSLAGRRLNLLPGADLMPRHDAMMAQLVAAGDFDATYRALQLQVHQDALTLHRNFAARGASPTLRPVAAAAVPIIERHLRLLRTL